MTDLLTALDVFHHVLIRLIRRIHSCFRTLYRQRERIHDDERVIHYFPLHQTHNLVGYP